MIHHVSFAQNTTNKSLTTLLTESSNSLPLIPEISIDESTNITLETTNRHIDIGTNNEISTVTNITLEDIIKEEDVDYSTILDGETSLMINEFRDIIKLYQRPPSNISSKVRLYQRLLTRLNNMQPQTTFLQNHRDLLKNTIRLFLGLRDRADKELKSLLKESPYASIKKDILSVLISFHYQNGEIYRLKPFLTEQQKFVDSQQQTNIDMIVRSFSKKITEEESKELLNLLYTPLNLYQHSGYKVKLLNNIQKALNVDDIYNAINIAFFNNDLRLALALIRIQVKKVNVDITTLVHWGNRLGSYKKDMVATLKMYQRRSEDYKLYVGNYQDDRVAYTRGRIFHRRLYASRGERRAPYNVLAAKKILDEYLKGKVEANYIEENAKRAFRNFLAYKKYDMVKEYALKMRSLVSNQVIPYVSFWGAYALLQEGQTNEAIPFLGEILTVDPESYWGLISQQMLRRIFAQVPYSQSRYFSSLKEGISENKKKEQDYAYITYYLGGGLARSRAEDFFMKEGLVLPSQNPRLSKHNKFLIQAYSKLNLSKNIRPLIFDEGITNIHDQDVLLMNIHHQNNNITDIIQVLGGGHRALNHKTSFMIGKRAMKTYFPMPYLEQMQAPLEKRKMSKCLLYSVMRAESFYKEKARSRAGARGLMQIMPVTGKWLVQRYLPELKTYSLYEPSLNVYLGSLYLYENIDKIGIIPALAAYNSGPTFVNRFISKYKPNTHIELAEIHPKKETRNYVRKVVEYFHYYSMIYGDRHQEYLQF